MPERLVNEQKNARNIHALEIGKRNKKGSNLSAADLALSSYVYDQDSNLSKDANPELRTEADINLVDDVTRFVANDVINDRNTTTFGAVKENEGNINISHTIGGIGAQVERVNSLPGFFSKLFGRNRFSDFYIKNAKFVDIGSNNGNESREFPRLVATNSYVKLAPGLVLDVKMIKMQAKKEGDTHTVKNYNNSIPLFTMYTGPTHAMLTANVDILNLSESDSDINFNSHFDSSLTLEEHLSANVLRKTTFSSLTYQNRVMNFEDIDKVVYKVGETEEEYIEEAGREITSKFIPGRGVRVELNRTDTYNAERKVINGENTSIIDALQQPDADVNAVNPEEILPPEVVNEEVEEQEQVEPDTNGFRIDKEKEYDYVKSKKVENKKENKEEKEDNVLKIETKPGIDISGKKDKNDNYSLHLGLGNKANLLKYMSKGVMQYDPETKTMVDYNEMKVKDDYDNFFAYMMGWRPKSQLTPAQKRFNDLADKLKDPKTRDTVTLAEQDFMYKYMTRAGIPRNIITSFSKKFLGEKVTGLASNLYDYYITRKAFLDEDGNGILEGRGVFDIVLGSFIGEQMTTLIREGIGHLKDSSEETPAIDYMIEYIKEFAKGKEFQNENKMIPWFDYPYDTVRTNEKKIFAKQNRQITLFNLMLWPFVRAKGIFLPGFSFTPKANLDIGPESPASSLGSAQADFRQKILSGLKSGREGYKKDELKDEYRKSLSRIKYNVKPSLAAEVMGTVSITLQIGAGLGIIAELRGKISGNAFAKGTLGASATFGFGMNDEGKFRFKNDKGILMNINGGISAGGGLSVSAGLSSDLFLWDVDIFKIDLINVLINILNFNLNIPIGGSAEDFGMIGLSATSGFSFNGFKAGLTDNPKAVSFNAPAVPSYIQDAVNETKDYNGDFNVLKEKVNRMLNVVLEGKEQIIIPGGEANRNFVSVLKKLNNQIKDESIELYDRYIVLTNFKNGLESDKNYLKKKNKIVERKEKHKERVNKYKIDPSKNKKADDNILEEYENSISYGYGKGDYQKNMKDKNDKAAKVKWLANYGMTINNKKNYIYEIWYNSSASKEYIEKKNLIKRIKSWRQNGEETFAEWYMKEAPDSKLINHLGTFHSGSNSKQRYIDFENERHGNKIKTHTDNIANIKKKADSLGKSYDLPSKEFSDWYLGAFWNGDFEGFFSTRGMWLKRQTIDYLSPKNLLNVIKKKIEHLDIDEKGRSGLDRISYLEEQLKLYKAKEKKLKNDFPNNPRFVRKSLILFEKNVRDNILGSPNTELGNAKRKELRDKFKRTSSNKDILEYEAGWSMSNNVKLGNYTLSHQQVKRENLLRILSRYTTKDGMKNAAINEADKNDILALISGNDNNLLTSKQKVDLSKIGFWKNRKDVLTDKVFSNVGNALNLLLPGRVSSIGKRNELIKSCVSLQTIIDYELKRSNENIKVKEKERHKKIYYALLHEYKIINKIKDEKERKNKVDILRKSYFSGDFDQKVTGVKGKTHKELIKRISDGDIFDVNVLGKFLGSDQKSYKGIHAQREDQFKELMENNEDLTDIEGYYKYHDIRDYFFRIINTNGGFEKSLVDNQKKKHAQFLDEAGSLGLNPNDFKDYTDTVSIEQLIRYEKRNLANASRMKTQMAGYLGVNVVDKITSTIPVSALGTDDEKIANSKAIYLGGYYGLYEKMQKWYAESEGKNEEEKSIEFSKKMRENMLEGAIMKQIVFKEAMEDISPNIAIQYENDRINETDKRYKERMKMLSGFSNDVTPEENLRYLEISRRSNTLKRVFGRDKNYMTGFDKDMKEKFEKNENGIRNNLLTPETAIRYHEWRLAQVDEEYRKTELAMNKAKEDIDNNGGALTEKEKREKLAMTFYNNVGKSMVDEYFSINEMPEDIKRDLEKVGTRKSILEYEQSRVDHYDKMLTKLNEPFAELNETVSDLEKNINWTQKTVTALLYLTNNDIPADIRTSTLEDYQEFIHQDNVIENFNEIADRMDETLQDLKQFVGVELEQEFEEPDAGRVAEANAEHEDEE